MLGTITGLLNYFNYQNNADAQRQLSETYERLGTLQYNALITQAQIDKVYAEMAATSKEKQWDMALGKQGAQIAASGLTEDSYSRLVQEAMYNAKLDVISVRFAGEVEQYNKYNAANEAMINAQIQSDASLLDAQTSETQSYTSLISGITSDIQTGLMLGGLGK